MYCLQFFLNNLQDCYETMQAILGAFQYQLTVLWGFAIFHFIYGMIEKNFVTKIFAPNVWIDLVFGVLLDLDWAYFASDLSAVFYQLSVQVGCPLQEMCAT